MRILYIHQYYKTPEEGGAIRSYYIASALVKAGHDVVMITSHNREKYEQRIIDGVEVHYVPVYYSNELNSFNRSRAFLGFLRQARKILIRLAPYDIAYVTSTPLTVGLLALYARQRFKIPFIFEVRDLWPEAPIQLGYINHPPVKRALQQLEQRIYAKAAGIIALSPGIARGVKESLKKLKNKTANREQDLHIIPNMADCQLFKPAPKNYAFAKVFELHDTFVISYFGAAGPSNHLEYLLEAAKDCLDHQLPVKFLVAATGSELNRIQDLSTEMGLNNIVFVAYGSKQQVKNWLAISDAVYTSFGPYPVLETNSPNKFFDGLAAGKLSIVNTAGWLKELVEEHRCGFYTKPDESDDFAQQLRPFLDNSYLLKEYQHNARRLAEEQFSKDLLTKAVIRLVERYGHSHSGS
ncbi:glycosyltransferase family 4 protein [Nafulsella turpanensis]|uniref:glycosyltransferase family 4 protein n=1 Tax=Nafulsella turpanensis TaxID=1265690 RepID=UPI00034C13C4|nr:glycosyltransferase family 4 protein [Nafulsella turpanensis]